MAHYVASKGGVIGLTKALAVEYASQGITVNTIPPGFVDTPMVRRAEARGDLPNVDAIAARTPVGRAGTPEDVAAACRVPLLRRCGLHHRPAHRRQRRLVPVTNPSGRRTPRVPPLPRDEWDDDVRAALAAGFGEAAVARFTADGADAIPVPNVVGTLMRHPTLAGPFLAYNSVLLRTPVLDPRQRELVILRVAARTRCDYEWAQHVRIAKSTAITDAEVEALAGTGRRDAWDALETDLLPRHRRADRRPRRLGRHVGTTRHQPRRAPAGGARLRGRHLHRAGDGVQQPRHPARRRPTHRNTSHRAPGVERMPPHREAGRRQLDGALSGARHRAHVVRGLDLPGVPRPRARRDLQAGVAERRPGRAAAPQRELLHQGARRREHLGRHRPRHRRHHPRVPQHLPAPRQQARVDGLPTRGVERELPAVRLQVPRLEVRPRRRVLVRPAGERVLRPRQG